ncbi:hypothetical protein PO909_019435 [Leuciscus waleckii]
MMVLSVSDNGKCFPAGLKSVFFRSLSPQDLDGPLGILVCLFVSAVLEYTGIWECIYHASNQSTWTNGPPSRYKVCRAWATPGQDSCMKLISQKTSDGRKLTSILESISLCLFV